MRALLFTAALLSSASLAYADGPCCRPSVPWYVQFSGYGVQMQDQNVKESIAGYTFTHPKYSYDVGYGAGMAVGYRVSPFFRGELEVNGRRVELNKVGATRVTSDPGKYKGENMLGFMANAYADLPISPKWKPYLGAGVGAVRVQGPLNDIDVIVQEIIQNKNISDKFSSEWMVGYQFMTGLSYQLPPLDGRLKSELVLGYRYFFTNPVEMKSKLVPGYTIKYENNTHNAEIGWRVSF